MRWREQHLIHFIVIPVTKDRLLINCNELWTSDRCDIMAKLTVWYGRTLLVAMHIQYIFIKPIVIWTRARDVTNERPFEVVRENVEKMRTAEKKINQNNCWLAFDKQVSFAVAILMVNMDKEGPSVQRQNSFHHQPTTLRFSVFPPNQSSLSNPKLPQQ